MKTFMKVVLPVVMMIVFLTLTTGSALAGDCSISSVIRCYFDIDDIYLIVDDAGISVFQSRAGQEPLTLNSISFEEIIELLTDLGEAGDRLVRLGKIEPDATLLEFADAAKKLHLYPDLTDRILSNGNLLLSLGLESKANIYFLSALYNDELPVFQINVGDEDGRIQVVTMTLFSDTLVLYDLLEFNIYQIDFANLPAQH